MEFSPSQFDGRRFRNIIPQKHGLASVLRWVMTRKPGFWPEWIPSEPGPPPPKSSDVLRITFINHATFLLQVDGLNLLTDPIWSYRVESAVVDRPAPPSRARHPLRRPAAD